MAERLPPKTSREPTAEVEVEPDTGQTLLPREPPRTTPPPAARPLGVRERKISVPPPPPLPSGKKPQPPHAQPPHAQSPHPPSPPPPPTSVMPESATPEPSVMLGSDAITLDPDSAPLTERPTQIVQPGMIPSARNDGPVP